MAAPRPTCGPLGVAEDVAPLHAMLFLALVLARCVGCHRGLTPERCERANSWLVGNIVVSFFVLQVANLHLDPAQTDYWLVATDSLSKVLISLFIVFGIVVASLSGKLRNRAERLDSFVTLFSLSTLTSTLAVGVPLTAALYGQGAEAVVVQLAVLQILVSSPIVLLLFYVRKAVDGGATVARHEDVDADDVGRVELPVRASDVADDPAMAEPVRDDGGVGVAAGDVQLPTAAEVANVGVAPHLEQLQPAAAAVALRLPGASESMRQIRRGRVFQPQHRRCSLGDWMRFRQ